MLSSDNSECTQIPHNFLPDFDKSVFYNQVPSSGTQKLIYLDEMLHHGVDLSSLECVNKMRQWKLMGNIKGSYAWEPRPSNLSIRETEWTSEEKDRTSLFWSSWEAIKSLFCKGRNFEIEIVEHLNFLKDIMACGNHEDFEEAKVECKQHEDAVLVMPHDQLILHIMDFEQTEDKPLKCPKGSFSTF